MAMRLSRTSVATLLYLVELKIGSMEVTDTDDRRSQRALKRCRDELSALMREAQPPKPSLRQDESLATAMHS
jgi:hypothetical protein